MSAWVEPFDDTSVFESLEGASNVIGHQLVPRSVGHWETSYILLPTVSNTMQKKMEVKQAVLQSKLCGEDAVRSVIKDAGLKEEKAYLGDILRAILDVLVMPKSLK
jgi:hypothetical protein